MSFFFPSSSSVDLVARFCRSLELSSQIASVEGIYSHPLAASFVTDKTACSVTRGSDQFDVYFDVG